MPTVLDSTCNCLETQAAYLLISGPQHGTLGARARGG